MNRVHHILINKINTDLILIIQEYNVNILPRFVYKMEIIIQWWIIRNKFKKFRSKFKFS